MVKLQRLGYREVVVSCMERPGMYDLGARFVTILKLRRFQAVKQVVYSGRL